jgi:hypothetical protein
MLRARSSGWDGTIAGLTPAFVDGILGVTPDLMYRYDEASGATELVAGLLNLTDSGSPSKQVTSTALGTLTAQYTAGSSTERTAHPTAADVGTGSVAFIHVYERITAGNFRGLFGKRTSATGNAGYEMKMRTAGFTMDYDGATTAKALTNTTDHGTGNAEVILTKQSPTDNESGVWTRLVAVTSTAATGSLSNSREFSIGDGFSLADGSRHALTLIFFDAKADGMGATTRSTFATALGHS